MSSLTSSGGGNDNLQVGIAIFCVIISIGTAMMVPVFAPGYDTGYSYQEIYQERLELEAYTGESMTSQTPWALTGVYEAYVAGGEFNIDPETGWIYGKEIEDYPGVASGDDLGATTGIRLDPDQKSSMTFSQDTYVVKVEQNKWQFGDGFWKETAWKLWDGLTGLFGVEASRTEIVDKAVNTWTYTGYRYEFDPMMTIHTTDVDGNKTTESAHGTDAKLSIIWYDVSGAQGIGGGLIVYDDVSKGVVSNYSSTDIIANYNVGSTFATKYDFNFEGTRISMYIQFDNDVFLDGTLLEEAWNDGRWTVAFTATSADDLLDIANSNTLSTSVGNILQTYADIFTFDLPNVPSTWSMVLWILCILPAEIVVLMFLSRYGPLGLLAGVVGNVLLGVL